jgi:hypothetical protein
MDAADTLEALPFEGRNRAQIRRAMIFAFFASIFTRQKIKNSRSQVDLPVVRVRSTDADFSTA